MRRVSRRSVPDRNRNGQALFRRCSVIMKDALPDPDNSASTPGRLAEPFIDHGAGTFVGAWQHVSVGAQSEGWIAVTEVLGQLLDGDTSGEHDAGIVAADLVDAFFAGSDVAASAAPVRGGFRYQASFDESGFQGFDGATSTTGPWSSTSGRSATLTCGSPTYRNHTSPTINCAKTLGGRDISHARCSCCWSYASLPVPGIRPTEMKRNQYARALPAPGASGLQAQRHGRRATDHHRRRVGVAAVGGPVAR